MRVCTSARNFSTNIRALTSPAAAVSALQASGAGGFSPSGPGPGAAGGGGGALGSGAPLPHGGAASEAPVLLKKWLQTRHATVFRLSNRTIQVDFRDGSEILLCGVGRAVTYVDRGQKARVTYALSALPESPELLKRLKYTKDILVQLLGRSGGGGGGARE